MDKPISEVETVKPNRLGVRMLTCIECNSEECSGNLIGYLDGDTVNFVCGECGAERGYMATDTIVDQAIQATKEEMVQDLKNPNLNTGFITSEVTGEREWTIPFAKLDELIAKYSPQQKEDGKTI